VRKQRRKLRSLIGRLEIAVKQPVSVDNESASHKDRWGRNSGIAPPLLGLFDRDVIDVAPDAANAFDAIILCVTPLGPRTHTEVDISVLLPSQIRNLTVLRHEVVTA
jgi:hypothetical protein